LTKSPLEMAVGRGGSIDSGSINNDAKAEARKTSDLLFWGSIISFVSGILLLMSFASPYWLQSWSHTNSPFSNMGLWEFCFNKFRHPDYQFDHLFHGCHALYGEEYRLIREKLLPGWLMVVQFFVTVAFISSYLGQIVIVGLLLRYPMERILKYEWQFVGLAFVFKSITAVLLFLAICIFGGLCWDRDWLLYPNYNYVSWSYALATFSTLGHIIAASFLFFECKDAKARKERNKALTMQMFPQQGFGSNMYNMQGSGFI